LDYFELEHFSVVSEMPFHGKSVQLFCGVTDMDSAIITRLLFSYTSHFSVSIVIMLLKANCCVTLDAVMARVTSKDGNCVCYLSTPVL